MRYYFSSKPCTSKLISSGKLSHFHFCCWHCQHIFMTICDWVLASFLRNLYICTFSNNLLCQNNVFSKKKKNVLVLFTFTSYQCVQNRHLVIGESVDNSQEFIQFGMLVFVRSVKRWIFMLNCFLKIECFHTIQIKQLCTKSPPCKTVMLSYDQLWDLSYRYQSTLSVN